jgi:hypothetical protein
VSCVSVEEVNEGISWGSEWVVGRTEANRFLCNRWYTWVITPELHEDFDFNDLWSTCFATPPKQWSLPQLHDFLRSRVGGVGGVWRYRVEAEL